MARGGTRFAGGAADPALAKAMAAGEFERPGFAKPIRFTARVIAVAPAILEVAVDVPIPPLNARRGDIARLALAYAGAEVTIPDRDWPNNEAGLKAYVLAGLGDVSTAGVVTMEEAERAAIARALEDAGGRVGGKSGAAARLGMKRTTLQSRMEKLGVPGPVGPRRR